MKRLGSLVKGLCFLTVTALIIGSVSVSGALAAKEKRWAGMTLTCWDWHTPEIPEILGHLYKQFEKEYNVKLQVTGVAFNDLPKKYMIAAKAGGLPDVGEFWAQGLVPEFAEEGWLEPLDPYIEKEGREDFLSIYADWAIPRYKGKVYGSMVLSGIAGLFWNKTRFAEAGIPGPPKTWQGLVNTAKRLTSAPDRFGLGTFGVGFEALMLGPAPFIYQNGGRIGKIDGKYQINSPESVEAIQFFSDLITKHKVIPSYLSMEATMALDFFSTGKTAMFIDASWGIPLVYATEQGFEWGTTVLPKGKVTGSPIGGWDTSYVMFPNCKDKELGWEFVKFMTSKESNHYWISETGAYLSAVNSVRREMAKNPLLAPFTEQASLPNAYNLYEYLPKQLERTLEIFNAEMHNTILGTKTAQEAMDEVVKEWIELDEAWEKKYRK